MTKLNKEQKEAIVHGKGPLLIIAGAGTGKTTVITERIKHIIASNLAKPSEVLALTFTNKAAQEMEERVDIAMPYGYTQMWVMTFHSFCDRVLRSEALHIGLDPRFKLMTEADSVKLVRDNLFSFDLDYFRPLGNPTKFIGGMLQHFSRLQDEDVSPSEYAAWTRKKESHLRELAGAYKKYEELKGAGGVMDFGDLVVKTLALLRQRPNILKQYQKQFKFVLVDEFQDTNYAQNELAILLAGNSKNITVAGDDDQSIYRFRGAAVSNIIQFRKHFPRAKAVTLNKNYRSYQEILDRAYALIQNNNPDRLEVVENVDKKLVSQRKGTAEVNFVHVDRVENEAEAVAQKIKDLVANAQYDYKDIAILVRANNHAEPFSRAFLRNNIPFQFLGPGRLFKQPEIIDLISYLKVLYDINDSVAFYRVLSYEHFDISSRDLAQIGSYAKRNHFSLFEACEAMEDVHISKDTREKIKKILEIINKHLRLARRETAGQILYYFLEDTALLNKLLNPKTQDVEKRAANISKFFDKLKTYEVDHEDATVPAVVDWIELSQELGESPLAVDSDWTELNAVNLLTVHGAKGLEFPVVFMVNLVSLRFPTIQRREQIPIPDGIVKEVLPQGDYHLQEERRLFYVGTTRAKDKLFFSAADYYGEGKREKKLSPFIFEALGDAAVSAELKTKDSKQAGFLSFSIPEIQNTKYDIPKVHLNFLSYSQIETFKICPLHYKLKYLLKVPTHPSASQSFGTSIHAALKDFFLLVKSGQKPSEKLLFKLLADNWIGDGFRNKSHEKKFFEKGKVYLAGFLKESFDAKNLPVSLEKPFVIPLGGEGLKVGGKIDRVDALPDGSVEIIDYKTGATIPSQREVDRNLQLSIYALAAVSIKEPPFDKEPKKVKLSLYFLDQQQKFSTVRTEIELEEAQKEILEWKKKIEKSDFTCSGNYLCRDCEYKLMCSSSEM